MNNEKKLKKLTEYLVEPLNYDMGYYFKTGKKLFEKQTPYQKLEIHEFPAFGKVLRLDGIFQTSEKDEYLYHEILAHVPGIALNGPETALVIGGGDGGAAEELLKYSTIKKVVMVELDEDVVEASKAYIPSISNGAFESEKLELRFEDGIKYIENTNERFDQIFLDLTDPFGPSTALYTKEFYTMVSEKLTERGVLSLHIESPVSRPNIFGRIHYTLKTIFKHVRPMFNYVPLYGTMWGFAAASNQTDVLDINRKQIKERIANLKLNDLSFYNADTHFSVLAVPKYIDDILKIPREPIVKGTNLAVAEQLLTYLLCKEE
ncbi:MAG: polyamine aminopropyltransferase [Spirochaetia bacterium]|nr:polyamine aminopropyltransferase [Spirochaetia bacterium]